jgi:hypothetical protein
MRTKTFWLFVVIGYTQMAVVLLIGRSTVTLPAALVITALVIWLGRGSRTAWRIFVLANGVELVGSLPLLLSSGGSIDWGDVITMAVGSVIELGLLLRPDLRGPSAPLAVATPGGKGVPKAV